MPTTDPAPAPTVADLVSYWTEVREHGPLAATTASAYLGAIARILKGPGITAATPLDGLDLPALTAAFTDASPDLKPSTRTSLGAQLRAAVNGYRTRHQPDLTDPFTPPAPEADTSGHEHEPEPHPAQAGRSGDAGEVSGHDAGEEEFDGTLGDLRRFTDYARRSGLFSPVSASNYLGTVRRILSDQPHLKTVAASEADPDAIIKQFAEDHDQLRPITVESYRVRLARIIAAYTAYLADQPPAIAPLPPVAPAATAIEIPLPGARTVRFSAPADLTDQEAAATGAVLRLHHPGITAPPTVPGAWTLVFWPEHAPDEPEAAHLTGPSFRRALADHIRDRCPELTRHDDEAAIDAWYATEVFVALAFDGHHHARDSGTLL
jgi:hypothetical protein